MSVRKSWFSADRNYRSIFRRSWTKVHQIKFANAGVIVVCNAVFRLTISCCVLEIFAIKLQSCLKSRRNFDVFGPPNFLVEGPPKFLTQFYKPGSPSNMWQSLVAIGRATSEIRRLGCEKRKHKETSAVKHNGRWPATWQAAIMMEDVKRRWQEGS